MNLPPRTGALFASVFLLPALGQEAPSSPVAPSGSPAEGVQANPADSDGDGKVSRDEFLAGPAGQGSPERAAERFARLDANGDGFLDAADREARARQAAEEPDLIAQLFTQIDLNQDGTLDLDEFRAHQSTLRAQGGGDGLGSNAEEAVAQRMRERMGQRMREEMAKIDANGDGNIDQTEFLNNERAQQDPEGAARFFNFLDRNEDGVINESDRPTGGGPWDPSRRGGDGGR